MPDLRVRHRHQQGAAGDQGGQPPQDPGRRHPRHQLRSGRHHLSRFPANDDAGRAIQLYCDLIARAAIDGISRSQGVAGHRPRRGRGAGRRGCCPRPRPSRPSAAPAEHFELLAAPRGAPDDLAKLTGVGPQIVKKLNEHGVFHYWQLAAMTPEEAAKLDADLQASTAASPATIGSDQARGADRRRRKRSRFAAGGASASQPSLALRFAGTRAEGFAVRPTKGTAMANITAAMVKELREKTGAGMMDCKNALNETNGDIEAAVDWLRKKGLAKAAKKSGRVAAEGLVAVAVRGQSRRRRRGQFRDRLRRPQRRFPGARARHLAGRARQGAERRRRGDQGRALSRRRHGRGRDRQRRSPPSART